MMSGVLVMNKKGFTLTELLAIIVLIALIIGIAAPSITEQVKTEEEERQNILNKKIEIPFDEDLYYTELMKRVANSVHKKKVKAVYADTSNSYNGNK